MVSYSGSSNAPASAGASDHSASTDAARLSCLERILETRRLDAVFQPIISLGKGHILGYEGLIRGPLDGPLHSPVELFKVARANDLALEVERLCCRIILERYAELNLPGKLFLNVSPMALELTNFSAETILGFLEEIGVEAGRIVFELTEHPHTGCDYDVLREVIDRYRRMGFQMAIDDMGEGFSSLRRWSELLPEYIKIDMHFIQGVDSSPVKQQFIRSLNDIAHKAGTVIVAEGVETENELRFLAENGIACGQGFYIAHPKANPVTALSEDFKKLLENGWSVKHGMKISPARAGRSAKTLLRSVPVVEPTFTNNQVCDVFAEYAELHTVPVVASGKPLGIITRTALIERFARPYQRELYGKKPCSMFMNDKPLVADKDTSLQQLSHILVQADQHRLISDFIITDEGRYMGIGTSHDLLRELTDMQIDAARYANPLTQLPGNVPINQHLDYLLQSGLYFCACYVDLDNFKPFNDVFGYKKGDDIIQMTGRILSNASDADSDFVGHIGGDDFLIMFQSKDWEQRCSTILREFTLGMAQYFDTARGSDLGGYYAKDRRGNRQFYALPSLSIGVIEVDPLHFDSVHQIAVAAAQAKTQAKKIMGSSIFVERRKHRPWASVEPYASGPFREPDMPEQ
ncbi:MAG TPA: GGDEF domain-containing protein [Eoetvoesiella sp.]|uniref:GGDEF domain-containing protein n=1 Tax=Eoetvoesiella sp. TaxID=1966355 RepID=UPI002BBAC230|nr:GGDEF domain-containing protein [Eoetvoesiella sp.]HWK62820.1 GGDEF domain-containing protein [Eoetvoesiella sp.]